MKCRFMDQIMSTNRKVFILTASVLTVTLLGVLPLPQNLNYSTIKQQTKCDRHTIIHSPENILGKFIQKRMSTDGDKYIVYDCSKARKGICGGWSDRLSGILSTLVISLLTKRRFLINHDNPCRLQDFLVPTQGFDWVYNDSIVKGRTQSFHNLIAHGSRNLRKYMTGSSDINTYFKHDISFVRMNWDFTEDFRKRPHIGLEIPWVTELHYADMYKQLIDYFFKPSPLLSKSLDDFKRKNRLRPKLACAHIRTGKNPNMPHDDPRSATPLTVLWKYFDKFNKTEYDFFIASDSDSVKSLAKGRYAANMIDTPGKITHIDQPNRNDDRTGFLKQLLDFYTLASCDALVLPKSGFSIFAAYIREKKSKLYCVRNDDLRPCSRYTIHNTFPEPILARPPP
ncbi:uncharacterized protein [Argopecten irradians]|uniref:uncharacterized protein n=1 Tax=Argopecten irradians TaxID=31199 RepID=UPI003724C483